ncbi:hypothetical protein [Amycolatopsis oliviviridis]|uniref:hypothetical protein n=1 Tax=Amycolatopsis oliviviridis TaxID=1471590 RepID=UPI00174AF4A4|nr:hypothetical protein [Amycolatopsis oliviviridis]
MAFTTLPCRQTSRTDRSPVFADVAKATFGTPSVPERGFRDASEPQDATVA